MHTLHLIEDWHLLVVTYAEPFTGADIQEVARTMGVPGPGVGEHLCALVDLRAIDVSKLSASDSQSSIAIRKARISGHPAEPLAFLLLNLRDVGSVRMHGQWAEALGLRDEKDTLGTTNLRAALDWLEARTDQPGLADSVASTLGSGLVLRS